MMGVDILARGLSSTAEDLAQFAIELISTFPSGLKYKGSVDYQKNLPSSAEIGDAYTVKYKGESGTNPDGREFAWDGSNWVVVSPVADLVFNPESENAQSGIAVNQGIDEALQNLIIHGGNADTI